MFTGRSEFCPSRNMVYATRRLLRRCATRLVPERRAVRPAPYRASIGRCQCPVVVVRAVAGALNGASSYSGPHAPVPQASGVQDTGPAAVRRTVMAVLLLAHRIPAAPREEEGAHPFAATASRLTMMANLTALVQSDPTTPGDA